MDRTEGPTTVELTAVATGIGAETEPAAVPPSASDVETNDVDASLAKRGLQVRLDRTRRSTIR
jgi:hypothetical protein